MLTFSSHSEIFTHVSKVDFSAFTPLDGDLNLPEMTERVAHCYDEQILCEWCTTQCQSQKWLNPLALVLCQDDNLPFRLSEQCSYFSGNKTRVYGCHIMVYSCTKRLQFRIFHHMHTTELTDIHNNATAYPDSINSITAYSTV